MKLHHLALVGVSAVALVACTPGMKKESAPTPVTPEVQNMPAGVDTQSVVSLDRTIELMGQNNLGQSGEAVISQDENGMAVVTLMLSGGEFTTPQPAHIHVGSCPNPGAVKYPLTNVVGGNSVTKLNVGFNDLMNSGEKMAINVHKSAAESSVYTACGDVN